MHISIFFREHLCQMYNQQQFHHPIRSLQFNDNIDPIHFLTAIELYYSNNITNTRISSKNVQDRHLWQFLGQVTNLLQGRFTRQKHEKLNHQNWLEIGTLSSHFKQILEKIQICDDLNEIAVIWKEVRDLLIKYLDGGSDLIFEVEKILSNNTNQFEPLAISFTEKKFGHQQNGMVLKHLLIFL